MAGLTVEKPDIVDDGLSEVEELFVREGAVEVLFRDCIGL